MPKLSSLKTGQKAQLNDLSQDAVLAQRLMATGLMPGHELDLQHKMPLGGPVLCRFPSGKVGIRREDAHKLSVTTTEIPPSNP